MTGIIDLFSGIGGFALAAYWAGIKADHHFYSEVDPYANLVYQRRFPESIPLGDIRAVRAADLPVGEWLVCGGFPCQPHSLAGERKGSDDERDLWPECARVLRELRPAVAVFENVPGLFSSDGGRFFNRVLSDISAIGYDCEWQIISAADVGAPHLRKRVWIVAYPQGERGLGLPIRSGQSRQTEADAFRYGEISNPDCAGLQDGRQTRIEASEERLPYTDVERRGGTWWATEPDVGRVAHGVPSRVDRLKGLGNAIVPQVAEVIFNLSTFDRWRK